MIKQYYSLVKPGIIYGNAINVAGGFFLASAGNPNYLLFALTLLGISLIMASGCVFNNYIDRDIDSLMERTNSRVLVKGLIPTQNALAYGATLGILGIGILFFYTNIFATTAALVGFFIYVVVYSMWYKRGSVYGTFMGSVAGAVPPLVGYLAVRGTVDIGAIIIFIILSAWQMPHSYAIAIYRLKDYRAAHIPVLPVTRDIPTTKTHMLVYILFFVLATLSLSYYKLTGYWYATIMSLMGGAWIVLSLKGLRTKDDSAWARKMFLFSLIVIVVFCAAAALDTLPV